MTSWHSYPKIYNLGHWALAELLSDPVTVEEKIDGSQFSFGRFGNELKCRSKGQQLIVDAPEKMFELAVQTAKNLFPLLKDGWTYRAEYLRVPKHNTLAYERIPANHLILFDVSPSEESYLTYAEKKAEAERLGLEIVPLMFEGMVTEAKQVFEFMERVSILGGQKIEGVVIKNYKKFGPDKKVLLAKHVSEEFKETNKTEFRKSNPTNTDVLIQIGEQYCNGARWNKAVQHLKERGEIEGSPRDIGKLLKEVQADIRGECEGEIKEQLYKWALPHIIRASTRGLPEWYKEKLVESQFSEPA